MRWLFVLFCSLAYCSQKPYIPPLDLESIKKPQWVRVDEKQIAIILKKKVKKVAPIKIPPKQKWQLSYKGKSKTP